MRNLTYSFLAALILLPTLPGMAFADAAADKGLEIAKEADKRDKGFGDTRSTMIMTLKNRHGQSSVRNLEIRALEVDDDGDKSMTVFHNPRDIRGTALLTFSHGNKDDEQWLYLPALKRVKRISSSNKSGPFMGSEFAYEDLSSQEVDKYTYKFIVEEKCGKLMCFKMERYPTDKKSGYKRQVIWLDKDEYRAQRIDFYDRKNELLKTLRPTEYKQYLKKYWRALKMNMVNHQSGKSTELQWKDFKFKTSLKASDFTQTRLKQVL